MALNSNYTWEGRAIATGRKCETMLATMGVWYLLQIFGVAPIINVHVPELLQQDIPQAKVYRTK